MKRKDAISYQFRTTANLIQRYIDAAIAEQGIDDVTGIHSWVIHYLINTPKERVFQKDIEEDLAMQRSTASRVLQRMERNGYIKRKPVSYDKRLKEVILTDKLRGVETILRQELADTEEIMRQGTTEKEVQQLFATIDKISHNLKTALEQLDNGREDIP